MIWKATNAIGRVGSQIDSRFDIVSSIRAGNALLCLVFLLC